MQVQEEFSITTTHHEGCIVLDLRGDLDEITAHVLDDTLVSFDGNPVIVDLTDITFICSASIHVLTRDRPQGRPALVAPNGHVGKVLEIVEASRTNEIFDDRQAALQSLWLTQRHRGIADHGGDRR